MAFVRRCVLMQLVVDPIPHTRKIRISLFLVGRDPYHIRTMTFPFICLVFSVWVSGVSPLGSSSPPELRHREVHCRQLLCKRRHQSHVCRPLISNVLCPLHRSLKLFIIAVFSWLGCALSYWKLYFILVEICFIRFMQCDFVIVTTVQLRLGIHDIMDPVPTTTCLNLVPH